MAKPKLFIGSSSEALKRAATTLQTILESDCTAVPWWLSPEFERGSLSTLDGLLAATAAYDFAAFLFTADDLTQSRSKSSPAPRDNVVFEYGLFMGVLGPLRTFAMLQTVPSKTIKIPSDLHGIAMPRFVDSLDDHELRSSVFTAAQALRTAIANCNDWWHLRIDFSGSWNVNGDAFRITIKESSLVIHSWRLKHRSLLLIVRAKNDSIDPFRDTNIARSTLRDVSYIAGDVIIEVISTTVIGSARANEVLQGYLFSVPVGTNVKLCTSIEAVVNNGGRLWKKIGIDKGSDS